MAVRADNLRVISRLHSDPSSPANNTVTRDSKEKTFRTQLEAMKKQHQVSSPKSILVRGHMSAVERGMVAAGKRAYRSLGKPAQDSIDKAVNAARESGVVTDAEAAEMGPMIAGALKAHGIG